MNWLIQPLPIFMNYSLPSFFSRIFHELISDKCNPFGGRNSCRKHGSCPWNLISLKNSAVSTVIINTSNICGETAFRFYKFHLKVPAVFPNNVFRSHFDFVLMAPFYEWRGVDFDFAVIAAIKRTLWRWYFDAVYPDLHVAVCSSRIWSSRRSKCMTGWMRNDTSCISIATEWRNWRTWQPRLSSISNTKRTDSSSSRMMPIKRRYAVRNCEMRSVMH